MHVVPEAALAEAQAELEVAIGEDSNDTPGYVSDSNDTPGYVSG